MSKNQSTFILREFLFQNVIKDFCRWRLPLHCDNFYEKILKNLIKTLDLI